MIPGVVSESNGAARRRPFMEVWWRARKGKTLAVFVLSSFPALDLPSAAYRVRSSSCSSSPLLTGE
jgi:hypothetical protein